MHNCTEKRTGVLLIKINVCLFYAWRFCQWDLQGDFAVFPLCRFFLLKQKTPIVSICCTAAIKEPDIFPAAWVKVVFFGWASANRQFLLNEAIQTRRWFFIGFLFVIKCFDKRRNIFVFIKTESKFQGICLNLNISNIIIVFSNNQPRWNFAHYNIRNIKNNPYLRNCFRLTSFFIMV